MRKIIGIGCFVVISFLLLVGGLLSAFDEYSFESRMHRTVGLVTSEPKAFTTGGRRSRHVEFGFDYTYTVAEKEYRAHGRTREQPTGTVTVYYDTDNPAESRVSPPSVWNALGIAAFGALCLSIFPACWWFFREKD